MEPATHQDIWANFLAYRHELAEQLRALRNTSGQSALELKDNDLYAAAMARVHYYRIGEFAGQSALPAFGDITSQAIYWKRHYNTYLGSGSPSKYQDDWISHGGSGLTYLDGCF